VTSATLALTADTARTIALVVVVGLVVGAVIMARVMRSIAQKVIAVLVLMTLAVAVWSQRSALSDCVDEITAEAKEVVDAGGQPDDTATCTFFGRDVTVSI
jgi:uncharacterized membrane protein YfcA